jgi:hypothetical protein
MIRGLILKRQRALFYYYVCEVRPARILLGEPKLKFKPQRRKLAHERFLVLGA